MSADPVWMKALLTVHVSCGFGSFLLAPVALATAKGGATHKRWGMVYLWCMGGVAATALPMALYRPVLFLAMVAVFSFYAAFAGYRVLKLKDLARGGSAKPIDWFAGGADVRFEPVAGAAGRVRFEGDPGVRDCGDRVWADRDAAVVCADAELCAEAEGEDVLVVFAPGKVYWSRYSSVDGVQRGDAACSVWKSCVAVALADGGGDSGDCVDYGLLQAEVCATGEDCGCGGGVKQGLFSCLASGF